MGLADFGKPANYLERQVARWKAQLDSYAEFAEWPGPSGIPGVDIVSKWLEEHRPPSFQPGILHGDYHLSNVLFRYDSAELAAIVDWELTTIGDPLLDLGWLMATWPDEGPAAGAVGVTPWDGFPTPRRAGRTLSAAHDPRPDAPQLVRRAGLLQARHHP